MLHVCCAPVSPRASVSSQIDVELSDGGVKAELKKFGVDLCDCAVGTGTTREVSESDDGGSAMDSQSELRLRQTRHI